MLRSYTRIKSQLVRKIGVSLVYSFLVLSCINLSAQPINTILNDVVSPTPAAAAFGKYTDIPVNHATGVPNISIPIATIEEGTLSLPIDLRYHASGIKVSDVPSWVGSGWNLNIGGIISRTVQGRPDDGVNGYYYFGDELIPTNLTHIAETIKGERDGEPDIFYYTIPGYTGKFHLEFENGTPQIKQFPKSDVKIEITSFQGLMFRQFTVTDPMGTRYIFGYYNDGQGVNKYAREFAEVESENPNSNIASWFLIRIESFDNLFNIDFNYSVFDYSYEIKPSCKRAYFFTAGCTDTNPPILCPGLENYVIDSYKLESITSNTKTISFTSVPSGDFLQLNKIKVSSGSYCKDFDLGYDNSTFGDRLTLKTVQEISCDGTESKPPFTLAYNSSPSVDRHSRDVDHWGYYNGANNSNANTEMNIPETFIPFGNTGGGYTEGGANRESNFTEMVKGTLSSITYPTGGSTEFIYEANTYKTLLSDPPVQVFSVNTDEPPNYDCITEITNSGQYTFAQQADIDNATFDLRLFPEDCINPDENEFNISIRVFKYVSSTWVDVGFMEYNTEDTSPTSVDGNFTDILYTGTTTPGLFRFDLETVASPGDFRLSTTNTYDGNKEVGGLRTKQITIKDGVTTNDIVKTYNYHNPLDPQFSSGILLKEPIYGATIAGVSFAEGSNPAPHTFVLFIDGGIVPLQTIEGFHLYYPNVEEILNNGEDGKITYEFDIETTPIDMSFPQDLGKLAVKRAMLVESSSLSSTDVEIQNTTITPVEPVYEQSDLLLKTFLAHTFSCSSGENSSPAYIAGINQYNLYTGVYQIQQKSIELDGVTTLTEYTYDPLDRFFSPLTEEMTNSDGKVFQTKYTYPHDVSGSVYTALVNANRLNPVTTEYFINPQGSNVMVDGTKTEFANFSVNTGVFPYPKYHRRYEVTWGASNNLISSGWVLAATVNSIDGNTGKPSLFQMDGWLPDTYTWTSDGLIDQRTFEGFTVNYDYFPGTRLLSKTTEVDGTSTDYTYDNLMRLETITENCKNTVTDISYFYGSPASGGNKIETTTTYPSSTNSALNTLTNVEFFDGIGRKIQSINKNQGPSSNQDIITAIQYDNRGLIISEYEPKAFSNNNGVYKNPLLYSWSKTTNDFYNDPLGRTKSITLPNWHATNYFYGSNATSLNGYSSNSLLRTTIVDGNNNKKVEYKDKRLRVVVSQSSNNAETSVLTTETQYDDKDRKSLIIPPGSSSSMTSLNYSYLYYGNDLVQEKKVPDMAKVIYRYNDRDLPIHYQDGFLLNEGVWHATQYDVYGRTVFTGVTTSPNSNNSSSNPFISASNIFSKYVYGSNTIDKDKIVNKESRVHNADGSLGNFIITNLSYDPCGRVSNESNNNLLNLTQNSRSLTYSYDGADNVTFEDYQHSINGSTHFIDVTRTIDFAGRADKILHKFDSGANVEISNTDYTEKNQVQRLYLGKTSSSYLQQLDYSYLDNRFLQKINNSGLTNNDLFYLELKYDQVTSGSNAVAQFNGNISEIISQVKNEDRLIYGFRYDFNDRLKNAYSRNINSAGSLINFDKFTSSYTYDDRGNLNTISRKGQYPFNGVFTSGDIDVLSLSYGNNSNQLSNITDSAPLISKKYGARDSGGTNYGYDSNGNIISDPGRGATINYNFLNLPRSIDFGGGKKIEWTYNSEGELLRKKVLDNANVMEDRHYVDQTEYKNGNLVQVNHDHGRVVLSKGCDQNHHLDGVLDDTKIFEGDHIFSTSNLSSISNIDFLSNTSVKMKDGFKVEAGSEFLAKISPCNSTVWQYEYVIKDHLGNNRVLFSDVDGNGSINSITEILDESHYYPFGMSMMGEWNSKLKQDYAYQYNGKELILDHDLDWYNYGARFYDPSIARFTTIDPLAESYSAWSPYHYTHDNPIIYTDPDGRSIIKGLKAAYNVGKRTYKTYKKTGKVNLKSVGKALKDEALNIIDNGATIIDPDASVGEKLLAGFDLLTGFGDEAKAAGKALGITDDAKDVTKKIGKSKRGKGSVDPSDRDPQRAFSKKQKEEMQKRQNGECPNCGEKKDISEMDGHHIDRHADGGRTTTDNGVNLCKDCHKDVHRKDKNE